MIYVQVDYGININLSGFIFPFVREKGDKLLILPYEDTVNNHKFQLLLWIFGFKPGDYLSPYAGQNEFLSALVAIQCLDSFLPLDVLAQIAACIEATIPFRKDKEGKSPYDLLGERLMGISQKLSFGWNQEFVDNVLQKCVRMANRDVENFGSPNSVKFLDNTWNLMPETNHDLKSPFSYTVAGYRTSMMKMLGFLSTLVPEQVFHSYKGVPSEEILQKLFANTKKNLKIAKLYLESKILVVGILEALSFRIGRNVPLSTLIGEIPVGGIVIPTLDHFLPPIPNPVVHTDPLELEVLHVLTHGRKEDTSYDMKNSPITAFLVNAIGFPEITRLFIISKDFYESKISAEDFLDQCDPFVIDSIINGVITIFEKRTKNLKKLKEEII
jgi:hypothetical protein